MNFKKILCGVDFSEPSIRAFHTAAEMARQSKAELYVLHVIEAQPVVRGWLPMNALSETMLMLEEKAQAAIRSLLQSNSRLLKDLKVISQIDEGHAFEEILNHARKTKADLIVVGAKGLASIDEVVSGSTAENLVRHAPASVLVVK